MPEPKEYPIWDFDAGLLPLNFANTAEWHASEQPVEKLRSYAGLLGWSKQAGLIGGQEAEQLYLLASQMPSEAAVVFEEALCLREVIYSIFSVVAAGRTPPQKAMEQFNAALARALARARIEHTGLGFAWSWVGSGKDLGSILGPILHSTADLLTSEDLHHVGECADDRGCGYLFLDTSRNHSRRWCSMESCGNRAKARRHYGRSKANS